MGPTDVNRIFWEEGGNDPQGKAGGPVLETGGVRDLTYESGPETLFKAGISYKFYQGIGWPQDTITLYFKQFQTPGLVPTALYNAVTSTGTLWGDGTPGGIGNPENPTPASNSEMGFEEDCANGVLPDVSFIGSKSGYDEHPAAIPAAGAQFLATKLEALASNEELWNTTVFIINYDENDGFFDHVVPPTPNHAEYPEEFVTLASPAGTPGGGLPIGAGFRVPAFVISPWTVGGQIFSDVSDHTSGLRLIEAVAAAGGLSGKGPVTFPNVSRWRRKTFSDWTGPCARSRGQAAPSNTQFDAATTAANLAAQTAAALLPLPTRPGADQQTSFTFSPTSGLILAARCLGDGGGDVEQQRARVVQQGQGHPQRRAVRLEGDRRRGDDRFRHGRRIVAHGIVAGNRADGRRPADRDADRPRRPTPTTRPAPRRPSRPSRRPFRRRRPTSPMTTTTSASRWTATRRRRTSTAADSATRRRAWRTPG